MSPMETICLLCQNLFSGKNKKNHHCFWKRNCKTSATMPQVPPIKENLSNLLELGSDGNCSLLFEEINQHLPS